eukprot:3816332-Rhodomonas_salina.1
MHRNSLRVLNGFLATLALCVLAKAGDWGQGSHVHAAAATATTAMSAEQKEISRLPRTYSADETGTNAIRACEL